MPIDLTRYPDADDIQLLLKSAKLWPADSDETAQALATQQAEIAASGAASEWEKRTGWFPFLAGPSATTRTFDSTDQYGNIDLAGGILSSPTVTISGSAQTVNQNYYLQPANAVSQGYPYTQLQFMQSHYATPGLPNRISVTARWGYCTSLPADVWTAIQKYAGVLTLMSVENLQSIASISQDGFSKAFDVVGIITQKDLLTTWGKDWDKAVKRYIRVTC